MRDSRWKTVILLGILMIFALGAHAQTASWLAAGPGAAGPGGPPFWLGPEPSFASNDIRATVTMAVSQTTDTVFNSGPSGPLFGAIIPAGATIDGVEVHIERRGSGLVGVPTIRIRLFDSGPAQIGNVQSDGATPWPAADAVVTLGGPADLWGATPAELATVERIQYDAFTGGADSGTLEVDNVTATVYYTPLGPIPPAGLPAATSWGLGVLCLALVLGGVFYIQRLRRLGAV